MAQGLRLAICVMMVTGGCGGTPFEDPETPFDVATSLATCDRQYDRPPEEVKGAVLNIFRWSGFLLTSEHYDELGGEWIARRPDGPLVTVIATSVDLRHTSVAIRIDPGNGDLVRFLGKRLTEELDKSPIGPDEPGKPTVLGTYTGDLTSGIEAGEHTCQILDFIIVHENRSGENAQLYALTESGSSIRMALASQSTARGAIQVTFTTDTVSNDDNDYLALQLSKVFAKQLMTSER